MCEYCVGRKSQYGMITKSIEGMNYSSNSKEEVPILDYDPDTKALVIDVCPDMFKYPINFCPMCGRALKEQFQGVIIVDANIYYNGANHLVIGDLTITNDDIYYKGKSLMDVYLNYKPDYVDVVRCRDCEHYRDHELFPIENAPDLCMRIPYGIKVEPDGFCKWGKRREE